MRDGLPKTWTLSARWILPIAAPPLERGTITVQGDRIVAVEPESGRKADIKLDHAAVMPGLVNAHTHLDLSGLHGKCPPGADFTAWLRAVVRHRRAATPETTQGEIKTGLAQSIRHGTTLLGDIAGNGLSWEVLAGATIRAVVFLELIGLSREKSHGALIDAGGWFLTHPATATCRPALSPHAPYSVSSELYAGAAVTARLNRARLATHVAETTQELELLCSKTGPFVLFLQELGVWSPGEMVSGLEDVLSICSDAPTLFVHANYLPSEIAIPAGSSVVYCPRTHAAFGHPEYPLRRYLQTNVRVALGTDSLASNPDLSVLAEGRFVRQRFPDVPGDTICKMMTQWGAEALGWGDETGSLQPGKSADLVVIPVTDGVDPHELVLQSQAPVESVVSRGRLIHPV
jgi:cytosine/adenosine deaminase-related metal-dependent hydrolase